MWKVAEMSHKKKLRNHIIFILSGNSKDFVEKKILSVIENEPRQGQGQLSFALLFGLGDTCLRSDVIPRRVP